jgi:hypothetical protein
MQLFAEERARLGAQAHERASDAVAAAQELRLETHAQRHEAALSVAEAAHARAEAARAQAHEAALAQMTGPPAEPAVPPEIGGLE